MPGTFKTEEKFEAGITEEEIKEEVRLRIKAGAINSKYEGNKSNGWTLYTVWNVIGEND